MEAELIFSGHQQMQLNNFITNAVCLRIKNESNKMQLNAFALKRNVKHQ
jgi:hypothetical protein